jgi:hypothetical protein
MSEMIRSLLSPPLLLAPLAPLLVPVLVPGLADDDERPAADRPTRPSSAAKNVNIRHLCVV